MRVSRLDWDDYRIEHIAKHNVEPHEVWEVCEDPLHLAHRERRDRYRLYGQTAEGRYLFVVLEQVEGTAYKPITARDMPKVKSETSGDCGDEQVAGAGIQNLRRRGCVLG